MSRLNWNQRHGPDEFDDTAPPEVHYDFDHRRNNTPGSQSWPEKFGPANIRRAWKAGLVVVAEVPGIPYPIAVQEARWTGFGKILEVRALERWAIADRIWTRDTIKGLTSSGLLIENKGESK